jgi:hypothetical protein
MPGKSTSSIMRKYALAIFLIGLAVILFLLFAGYLT